MTWQNAAWLTALGIVLMPLSTYFCVKLGTYGYLMARFNFARRYQEFLREVSEAPDHEGRGRPAD